MAIITIKNFQQLGYREGFDVSVLMIADDGRERHKTFFVPGKTKPTKISLKNKLDKFSNDFNIPVIEEKIYSESEINEILVQKKYLIKGEKFPDDLPVKEVSHA